MNPTPDPTTVEAPATGEFTLTPRQITAIAKAIADPNRFHLLQRIAQGEARCADLRTCLTISAPTMSHHMKELDSAGLITTSRCGKFVSATLNREIWTAYLNHLHTL